MMTYVAFTSAAITITCRSATPAALASSLADRRFPWRSVLNGGVIMGALSVGSVFQKIAGLAVQRGADLFQRCETHAFHMPRFEQRKIGFGDAYDLRQLLRAHLAPRQHHVEVDDDGHHTKLSFSSAIRRATAITRAITSTAPARNSEKTSSLPRLSEILRCPGPAAQLNSSEIGACMANPTTTCANSATATLFRSLKVSLENTSPAA